MIVSTMQQRNPQPTDGERDIWTILLFRVTLNRRKKETIVNTVSPKYNPKIQRGLSPHSNASASREERVGRELVMEKFLQGCWMLHKKQCPGTGSTGLLTTREKFK